MESGICRLLAKTAFSASFSFSRNEDIVVAGYSDKQFHHVPGHVYVHAQRTSASVAVPAANTCQHLCHLHPMCDYAQYLKQTNGALNMLCSLMN
ncbi:hypothetical protein RvY_00088 [Ramazzottius varieornatus]|uniref:Apple domain-containing protein n=1 Tax=Ramazzottius varieornatus TaxID=947166 RepID=A0A1D1UFQ2_RAMVA|nr:hypothetical protein RvY_00088 [Ramazzottius varieornatus]